MGDDFFKLFFGGAFLLIVLVGGVMFLQMEAEAEDKRAIKNYLESRGKAPIPRSWRERIGDGI